MKFTYEVEINAKMDSETSGLLEALKTLNSDFDIDAPENAAFWQTWKKSRDERREAKAKEREALKAEIKAELLSEIKPVNLSIDNLVGRIISVNSPSGGNEAEFKAEITRHLLDVLNRANEISN